MTRASMRTVAARRLNGQPIERSIQWTFDHLPGARMHRLRLSVALLVLGAAALGAQEKKADTLLTVDKYLDFEQVAEPRVSPDGSQIVYSRRWVNKLEDRFESSL